jgi:hypothetical protein
MKFGRDLVTSMVAEWESQYCNYNLLKEVNQLSLTARVIGARAARASPAYRSPEFCVYTLRVLLSDAQADFVRDWDGPHAFLLGRSK